MRHLDFLIAGVQKAGTTALHHYLSRHRRIFLPVGKELHFFDDESLDWESPDYGLLHSHFTEAGPSDKIGEATPIYTYWPPAIERIRRYNGALKLIVVLRDPVQRAYSHWVMETMRGKEVLGFGEAIRVGRQRMQSRPEGPGGCHRVFSYVERGLYAAQIERLLAAFPRNQLLFLKSEDLRRRHVATLAGVCRFLEISDFEDADVPQPSHVPSMYAPVPDAAVAAPIPAEDAAYLSRLYREDIERTQRQTELDLSSWLAAADTAVSISRRQPRPSAARQRGWPPSGPPPPA